MFEFVRHWLVNARIRQLEGQLQGRPTPQLYLQLADAFREVGNTQRAAQILRLGATRFPNSPELSRRQAEAERVERENEKRRLHERIQSHPNPILYAHLAELYKADGDVERTRQICQAGIKAFPRYGGSHLVLGQMHVEKQEWEQAITLLDKAVDLDKYNYLALKLLAQVLTHLDRPADAARRLEEILYFAPGDEAIQQLLIKAREAAGELKPSETSVLPKPEEERKPARPSQMLRTVTRIERAPPPPSRDRVLADGLTRLRIVEGVHGALLVDHYGLLVAAALDPSLDEALAGALITNVYRTTSGGAAKLGVGVFEEGTIEADGGNVYIVQLADMILAVFTSQSVMPGLLEQGVRDLEALVEKGR
jgi:predicted regulator of Ras-like GTPase activity (Roadblock/LC7/MglB family)